jgi:hypothetical protein
VMVDKLENIQVVKTVKYLDGKTVAALEHI